MKLINSEKSDRNLLNQEEKLIKLQALSPPGF